MRNWDSRLKFGIFRCFGVEFGFSGVLGGGLSIKPFQNHHHIKANWGKIKIPLGNGEGVSLPNTAVVWVIYLFSYPILQIHPTVQNPDDYYFVL